jgi:DNA-binding NarL/FixJ family response regulator
MAQRVVVAIAAESPRHAELAAALAEDEALIVLDIDAAQAAERFAGPRVLIGARWRALAERLVTEQQPVALLADDAAPERVLAAIAAVRAGLQVRDAALLSLAPPSGEPPGEPLTPRELEVFELVAKGLSNPDIAATLGISAHTAKFHVGQILAKIGAATRAEAVRLGLRLGLIGV